MWITTYRLISGFPTRGPSVIAPVVESAHKLRTLAATRMDREFLYDRNGLPSPRT